MRHFSNEYIISKINNRDRFGGSTGSVTKGILLGLFALALGTGITLYFLNLTAVPTSTTPTPTATEISLPQDGAPNFSPLDPKQVAMPETMPETVPETMLEVEYSISHIKGASPAKTQKVHFFQAGDQYSRYETEPNYFLGNHNLLLINKDDQWSINLFTKSGFSMKAPIKMSSNRAAPIPSWGFNGPLYFGEEVQFFIRNNAKRTESGGEEIYSINSDKTSMKLYVNLETKKPVRIEFKGEGIETLVTIIKYNTSLQFDESRFSIPKGIKVAEASFNPLPIQSRRWLSEDLRVLEYYKSKDSGLALQILKDLRLRQPVNPRAYLSEFFGVIMVRRPELIKEIVKIAEGSEPEVQLVIARALRRCQSEGCLTELRANPFKFDENELQKFLEVANSGRAEGRGAVDPDSLIARFVVSGDLENIELVINFFDEQLDRLKGNDPFIKHVNEYALSLIHI